MQFYAVTDKLTQNVKTLTVSLSRASELNTCGNAAQNSLFQIGQECVKGLCTEKED